MTKNDVIKIVENRIERKIKEYRESWTGHLNQNIITKRQMMEAEINGLKELLKEINYKEGKAEIKDKYPLREENDLSPKETNETNVWQVFITPSSINKEDRLCLFYNKNTTEYHMKYKGEIIFNTENKNYYHFENINKTWRYRKVHNRIELAGGLSMVAYKVARDTKLLYPSIKQITVSNFLKSFVEWLFINEVPEEDRDINWKNKKELLEKEGK